MTVNFPFPDDLLRGFPSPHIEGLPDHLALQTPFDRNRAVAMTMLSPLTGELARLEMASEQGKHVGEYNTHGTQKIFEINKSLFM